MNEKQKGLYDKLYQFAHDENLNCTNLASLADLLFPEEVKGTDIKDGLINETIRKVIIPYLEVRAKLGKNVMEIFYELEKGG